MGHVVNMEGSSGPWKVFQALREQSGMSTPIRAPLWIHAVLWSIVALGVTIGALRPLKAFIIGLQFKHRASDWKQ